MEIYFEVIFHNVLDVPVCDQDPKRMPASPTARSLSGRALQHALLGASALPVVLFMAYPERRAEQLTCDSGLSARAVTFAHEDRDAGEERSRKYDRLSFGTLD